MTVMIRKFVRFVHLLVTLHVPFYSKYFVTYTTLVSSCESVLPTTVSNKSRFAMIDSRTMFTYVLLYI